MRAYQSYSSMKEEDSIFLNSQRRHVRKEVYRKTSFVIRRKTEEMRNQASPKGYYNRGHSSHHHSTSKGRGMTPRSPFPDSSAKHREFMWCIDGNSTEGKLKFSGHLQATRGVAWRKSSVVCSTSINHPFTRYRQLQWRSYARREFGSQNGIVMWVTFSGHCAQDYTMLVLTQSYSFAPCHPPCIASTNIFYRSMNFLNQAQFQ